MRPAYRPSILLALVAVPVAAMLLLFAPPAHRAAAQWDGPPADRAEHYWRQGYVLHVLGAYGGAIERFRKSIELRPSAEGHTYLGWSLSHLGRLDEAIAECRKAIEIDPGFGNPYNDIGVYLIRLGRLDEAIPWLEKAVTAERYCCYQFPNFTLGQIRLAEGDVDGAVKFFERALRHAPDYAPAREALKEIRNTTL